MEGVVSPAEAYDQELSDELCQAFLNVLTKQEPTKMYSDKNFSTPSDAYHSFLEIARTTIPDDKLRVLIEARGKETLEEALSVEFVFSAALTELRERLKRS